MRILVMGLPGAGKTTLAKQLAERLSFKYKNADNVRKLYKDWDFSHEGRLRQAVRMRNLSKRGWNVCDFVCPLNETRLIFKADFIIWMDTIQQSRFNDTNAIFEQPNKYNIRITDFNYSIDEVVEKVKEFKCQQ